MSENRQHEEPREPSHSDADEIAFEEGSVNVFEDLGLPDAAERSAKAELSRVISRVVQQKGWERKQAAEVLGIALSDLSDLLRGKVRRFSQERLERFLNALDMDVQIRVGPRPAWKQHASVSVEHVTSF